MLSFSFCRPRPNLDKRGSESTSGYSSPPVTWRRPFWGRKTGPVLGLLPSLDSKGKGFSGMKQVLMHCRHVPSAERHSGGRGISCSIWCPQRAEPFRGYARGRQCYVNMHTGARLLRFKGFCAVWGGFVVVSRVRISIRDCMCEC